MPIESYDIEIDREISATESYSGTVRLTVEADSVDINKNKVTISYIPKDGSAAPPESMFIGLVTPDGDKDVPAGKIGMNMIYNKERGDVGLNMTKDAKTSEFTAEITMAKTGAALYSLHANVDISFEDDDIGKKQILFENIILANGKLITEYYDHGVDGGHIEQMIFDGKNIRKLGKDELLSLNDGEEIVSVYYPNGYKSSEGEDYNLQVVLDGEMLLGGDPFGNRIAGKNLFDNLIATGKMTPTVVVFVESKKPIPTEENKDKFGAARWDGAEMPRLQQNACNTETHDRLVELPAALHAHDLKITSDPRRTCISGFSMTGLQALYTAIRRPDVYANVTAHSPSLWWGPHDSRLADKKVDRPVTFNDDETWRAPLTEESKQQYLLEMVSIGHDKLSKTDLPHTKPKIFLQAGTYEDGKHGADEPLVQATINFAKKICVTPLIHHGGHNAPSWSAGLCEAMPKMHAKLEDKKVLSSGDIASSFKTVKSEEKVKSPRISKGAT